MAKWKPTPPKTDALIRAGRKARTYKVSIPVEKRFKRGMRLYAIVPLLLGIAAAYCVHQFFFTFILPPLTSWIRGLGNYPNFYLAAIYGFGIPIFLMGGQLLSWRFSRNLVAGLVPLDEGLSLLQQRAEYLTHRGWIYMVGLVAFLGAGIYLGIEQKMKVWFLLTIVSLMLLVERFVLPKLYPLPVSETPPED